MCNNAIEKLFAINLDSLDLKTVISITVIFSLTCIVTFCSYLICAGVFHKEKLLVAAGVIIIVVTIIVVFMLFMFMPFINWRIWGFAP
jgi:hypothetical protein